jgi:polyisoprenyl-phosphate glycosyltransferase
MHIVVLMPVLNDWVPAQALLSRLDEAFAPKSCTVSAVLIDDGSTDSLPSNFGSGPYVKLECVNVLKLKKNLGHQRALAVGLCYAASNLPGDAVVVMDSDGQDDPADAVRLVERLTELEKTEEAPALPIIFAERTRRSESVVFQLGYAGYRTLHHALTGRGIRFGNFSIIPRSRLGALTTEPMLWNHYAASVVGARLPFTTIPSTRAQRITGKSRLNFINLVTHGLSALSCYSDTIGVRLLLFSSLLFFLTLSAVLVTFALKFLTNMALPGWTSLFAGILIIFLLQVITLASNFTMQIISARSTQSFLPIRDYVWYVNGLYPYFNRTA